MGKIRNVFIKQHQRGRWRYHWGWFLRSFKTLWKLTALDISIFPIYLYL